MAKTEGATTEYLAAFFERQKKTRFADLSGLDLRASVPVSQAVMDDLLSGAQLPDAVRSFRVRLAGNDLLVLEVGLAMFLFKTMVRVEARVERFVAFPGDPVVKLTLLTGGLVEMGLNVFKLPPWIKVEGRQVGIDLGMLLRQGGQGWLIGMLREVRIHVTPGNAVIEARLTVDGAARRGDMPGVLGQ